MPKHNETDSAVFDMISVPVYHDQ